MSDSISIATHAEDIIGHIAMAAPTDKRVRVEFGGETIADSTQVQVVYETGIVPVCYFPEEDVRMDLFTRTDTTSHCPFKGDAIYWTLKVGGRTEEDVAWGYPDPIPAVAGIKDHVALYFARMDRWLEEDEQIFGHFPDPYKRIDIRDSHRRVEIMLDGEKLATTTRARFLFETGVPVRYYIPAEDARMDLMSPSDTITYCPYKGSAHYHTLTLNGKTYEDLVWYHPYPIAECIPIKDYISFYWTKVDEILIDGAPQSEVRQTKPPVKIGGVGPGPKV